MNHMKPGPAGGYKPLGLAQDEYTRGGPQNAEKVELTNLSGREAFFEEVSSIRIAIRSFEGSIQTLSQLSQRSLNAVPGDLSSADVSAQIDLLTKHLRRDAADLTKRVATLGQSVGSDEARRGQWEALKAGLQRAVGNWQTVEQQQRSKVRERMARQYKIVKPDATEEEIKAAVAGGLRSESAQAALKEATSRQADIQRIEQTLIEVAQLFAQVSQLVAVQDVQFISIEEAAQTTERDMEAGVTELKTAKVSAMAARHKRKIIFGVVVAILIVIGVVVALEFTKKK